MSAAAAEGSIWNQGNWLWESKSFAKNAVDEIKERLLSIEMEGGGVVVKIVQIHKLTADASLHIRRGKRVATFDISFTARWEGWKAGGPRPEPGGNPSGKQAAGEVTVTDIMQDDVESDFAVNVYMSSISGHNAVDVRSKEVAKAGLPLAVRAQLRAFSAQLSQRAAQADAAATDKAKREEEAKKTAHAVADAGAIAERERCTVVQATRLAETAAAILPAVQAEKAAEQAGRQAQLQDTQPQADVLSLPVPLKVESAGAAPEVRPSDWNEGAWSWETRDLSTWSHAKLVELLSNVEFDVPPAKAQPGAFLKTIKPDILRVEASASLRKGKKLLIWEVLACELPWEGSLIAPDGSAIGHGDGVIKIMDLDQDSLNDGAYTCAASADEEGGEQDALLASLMQSHGVPLLKAKFHAFAQELQIQAVPR